MNAGLGAVALGSEPPVEAVLVLTASDNLQVSVEAELNLRQHVSLGALMEVEQVQCYIYHCPHEVI